MIAFFLKLFSKKNNKSNPTSFADVIAEPSFPNLAEDPILEIMLRVDLPTLMCIRESSRQLHRLANSPAIWKQKLQNDFDIDTTGPKPTDGWKAQYIQLWKMVRDKDLQIDFQDFKNDFPTLFNLMLTHSTNADNNFRLVFFRHFIIPKLTNAEEIGDCIIHIATISSNKLRDQLMQALISHMLQHPILLNEKFRDNPLGRKTDMLDHLCYNCRSENMDHFSKLFATALNSADMSNDHFAQIVFKWFLLRINKFDKNKHLQAVKPRMLSYLTQDERCFRALLNTTFTCLPTLQHYLSSSHNQDQLFITLLEKLAHALQEQPKKFSDFATTNFMLYLTNQSQDKKIEVIFNKLWKNDAFFRKIISVEFLFSRNHEQSQALTLLIALQKAKQSQKIEQLLDRIFQQPPINDSKRHCRKHPLLQFIRELTKQESPAWVQFALKKLLANNELLATMRINNAKTMGKIMAASTVPRPLKEEFINRLLSLHEENHQIFEFNAKGMLHTRHRYPKPPVEYLIDSLRQNKFEDAADRLSKLWETAKEKIERKKEEDDPYKSDDEENEPNNPGRSPGGRF